MDQQINKQFIRKYLNGECNASELQTMSDFLQQDGAQQLIDQVWAEEWDGFQEKEISDQEIAQWKNRFQKQLQDQSRPKKNIIKKLFTLPYAAVWAGLILGISTWYGITVFKEQKKTTVALLEAINPNGQRSKILLPDSSIVYLGGGSKLIYPDHFINNTREITLQGEAFFEVTKNPDQPFIIHTGNLATKVLGTSFRINAFKNQPLLVEVATGKVRVDQYLGNSLTSLAVLTPGQSLTWDHKNAVVHTVDVADVKEWKNGRLVFNGATLQELTAVLERWYNVKTIFSNPIKAKQHITITLTANVPLTNIMQVLAGTGKFQYRLRGNQIIIN